MKKTNWLMLVAACGVMGAMMVSCSEKKSEGKAKHAMQASIGQPSEVLLITDTEVLNSDVCDSLEALLTANVPGLNQGEDYFRTSRIPASMDEKEFRKMHSRLIAKVDSKRAKAELGVARDVYAHPQLQLQIAGPTVASLREFISSHAEQIRQYLLEDQLVAQQSYLRAHHSSELQKAVRSVIGYTVNAPEEIKHTKKGKDFVWGSSRTNEKQLNMVFYKLPYNGADLHDECVLAALRDSVMKANIPGSEPDQWMETTWEGEQPIVLVAQREVCGKSVSEMRGLWQMHNGAMGGPFVSWFMLDKDTGQLVVAEGFVYSPSSTKRDLVRRLEAALRTFRK